MRRLLQAPVGLAPARQAQTTHQASGYTSLRNSFSKSTSAPKRFSSSRRQAANWSMALAWDRTGSSLQVTIPVCPQNPPRFVKCRLDPPFPLTNRTDWTAEQVVTAYSGQQQIEQVFRGLKDGDWLGWGPMYHWTDSKIRVHAFYCMLGISLLKFIHKCRKLKVPGRDCPWNSCWMNCDKSNSSSCSIPHKETKDLNELLPIVQTDPPPTGSHPNLGPRPTPYYPRVGNTPPHASSPL